MGFHSGVATAAALVAGISGCSGSDDTPLPARVTLEGIAGVQTVNTTPADVKKAWKLQIPMIETSSGSSNVEFGVFCAGNQRGLLVFLYGDLKEIMFYSGALTDRGVGTGSTLGELRRAYGSRLERTAAGDTFSRGSFRVLGAGDPPRNSIDFDLDETGRVAAVRFGRAARKNWVSWDIYGVSC